MYLFAISIMDFSTSFLNTAQVGLSGLTTSIQTIFGLYFTLFSSSSRLGFHQFFGSKL
ncbi:MAG: hypothetical protein ACOZBL_05575 [Patescibacteria group bacterium]